MFSFKKTAIATAVAAGLGIGAGAQASQQSYLAPFPFTGSNFTMFPNPGGTSITGGTNDVHGTWDGTVYTSQTDVCPRANVACSPGNMTMSSTTPFFGNVWTASNIMVFGPGSYTFTETNGKTQKMVVGAGQLGAHMLFAWNGNKNIGVVDVWNTNADYTSLFWGGATKTTDSWSGKNNHIWNFASTGGAPMINGPFAGFYANFSIAHLPYTFTGSNFTMFPNPGGTSITGGTNDVHGTWDGTVYTSQTDVCPRANVACSPGNMTMSSTTPFFGNVWTASNIMVFGPGSYTFTETNGKTQKMVVGAGQLGAHMLFAWNGNKNIGVVDVWNTNADYTSLFWGGATKTTDSWSGKNNHIWNFASTGGAPMINGPFNGFYANFSLEVNVAAGGGGGNAVTTAAPFTSGDTPQSGGCSISPSPTRARDHADWWLVGGLLAWLAAVRQRRKQDAA